MTFLGTLSGLIDIQRPLLGEEERTNALSSGRIDTVIMFSSERIVLDTLEDFDRPKEYKW